MVIRIGSKILTGKDRNVGLGFEGKSKTNTNDITVTENQQIENKVEIVESGVKIPTDKTTNTIKLLNGELFTYNNLDFDKSALQYYAPVEVAKGWYVDRSKFKTHFRLTTKVKTQIEEYEANKDNPKSKVSKPCLDRHIILQVDTEFTFLKKPLGLQSVSEILTQENRTHLTTQIKFLPATTDSILSPNIETPNILFASKYFAETFNPLLKSKGYQELPILEEQNCDVIDYLNLVTEEQWTIKYNVSDKYLLSLPKLFISISAHNAEAELNLIFHGELEKRILELQAGYSLDEGIIRQGKVLKAFSNFTQYGSKCVVDWVSMKAVVTIDNEDFHWCIRFIDTIKSHGIVSLSNFAKASNYKLDTKDFLSKKDKEDMENTFINRPEDSIAYALGDTCNLEIQYSFDDQVREIYNQLKLSNYTPVSLTIGRTVADLDYSVLAEALDIHGENWFKEIEKFISREIQPFSPATTIKNSTHSSAILAKGFGGRIGQNQPTEVVIERKYKKDLRNRQDYGIALKNPINASFKLRKIKGKYDSTIIIDIDISGCYAESQRVQIMPMGKPVVGGLKLDTISNNSYPIFGEFLTTCSVDVETLSNNKFANYSEYKNNWHLWGELEYGCFNLFIEIPELKEPCDLLPSWLHPGKKVDYKMICKLLADAIKGDEKAIDKIQQGHTKKLLNQAEISPINFDCLEWLFFIATPNLRKELLEKARVIAFVIYPKSYRITSNHSNVRTRIKQCQERIEVLRNNWKIDNTLKLKFSDKFVLYSEEYRDCHYWYGETIGDLILGKIIEKRKIAQWIKKKCPLDLLYKLFNNTHYGVSISPLFAISNICVGNNITARCRVLAWCMEKGLLGYPTITDGCFYMANRVLGVYDRPIASNCINMDSPNSPLGQRHYTTQPVPYDFNFEDKYYSYQATTKEYVMKNMRIFALCEVKQFKKPENKITKSKIKISNEYSFETLIPLDFNKNDTSKILATQAKLHLQNHFPLISVIWMDAKSIKVKEIKPEYKNKPSNEKTSDMVEIFEESRKGLADFEIKDYYYSGANHGMANYLLINEKAVIKGKDITEENNDKLVKEFLKNNKSTIGFRGVEIEESDCTWQIEVKEKSTLAYRGYESGKPHVGIINIDNSLEISKRYENTNPAKDFMSNLIKDGNNIPRQFTVIKCRSISVGDYKNNPKKFNEAGFVAGDQIKMCLLFTEFSVSQFTFKNKQQYFAWVEDIQKSKDNYGQSLEAWFINPDGTLRFKDLCLWSANAIERGVISPINELMSYGKRSKPKIGSPTINLSEHKRYHPEWIVFKKVKLCLSLTDLMIPDDEIETDSLLNELEE